MLTRISVGHKLAGAIGPLMLRLVVSSTPAAAVDLNAARADIEAHKQVPKFTPPGEPFDARACMKDKKNPVRPLLDL